ncbi:MAG: 1-(5-phosphoribosyl)-5-amino-4-imidazole-carboxylate carboxylase [Nitrospirae bacterium CG_4_10_14_3_um_filter_44_29]|nr:nickel pincer cofactor biosynthesis protein LarB [Nitrospirota bacterium]PIV40669.1 MAG: 1-(5-phosphoribosyl)-5-amino-4-imidazole-carboxylate carboxylase [Nitrospirae bacterium CG02_land_8_20_14_3_00_44_33]PIV67155.1 MAG: 1-(5-phosphoribosyl)-5-amino-4-imidazole-carboxylate carboxylase [Nitrospirae bacterium CG01_land_8_20_14_3_00_44_22]PIW89734.1 MAG: 1-(5-phosphoribosyl)-5-amino-4-imidazole-carboxylate carboxylase [Nitrospirae bacterium CG_4_8_14_3_um_filter_44_28]PIX89751.1 MAG: 1-(5-phos
MDNDRIKKIISSVKSGSISVEGAVKKLKHFPYEDVSFAKVDHHRRLRQGVPEVIFASGKTKEQVVGIAKAMYKKSKKFLITKAAKDVYNALKIRGAVFHPASGIISIGEEKKKRGSVLVLTAGTSDISVAEEAAVTALFLGSRVNTIYDVGVAGLHRLMDNKKYIKGARVIIVVAGMEGALPSVVGGLTDKPIIAVPTSIGYGTSLGGLTALFAMLNSCVPGIAVMNVDNGFGAGCLAHKINTLV